MKYDLNNKIDKIQAETYFKKLIASGNFIELKKINPKKTNPQNSYLHLILSWFAIEYGDTLDYVKLEYYKKEVNRNDFKTSNTNFKTGEIREAWKSIKDFDTRETTNHIEKFRNWSAAKGIYLPAPNEKDFLMQIEKDIERFSTYL